MVVRARGGAESGGEEVIKNPSNGEHFGSPGPLEMDVDHGIAFQIGLSDLQANERYGTRKALLIGIF